MNTTERKIAVVHDAKNTASGIGGSLTGTERCKHEYRFPMTDAQWEKLCKKCKKHYWKLLAILGF